MPACVERWRALRPRAGVQRAQRVCSAEQLLGSAADLPAACRRRAQRKELGWQQPAGAGQRGRRAAAGSRGHGVPAAACAEPCAASEPAGTRRRSRARKAEPAARARGRTSKQRVRHAAFCKLVLLLHHAGVRPTSVCHARFGSCQAVFDCWLGRGRRLRVVRLVVRRAKVGASKRANELAEHARHARGTGGGAVERCGAEASSGD